MRIRNLLSYYRAWRNDKNATRFPRKPNSDVYDYTAWAHSVNYACGTRCQHQLWPGQKKQEKTLANVPFSLRRYVAVDGDISPQCERYFRATRSVREYVCQAFFTFKKHEFLRF